MEFEIAKKLEKLPSNIKGNSLRSIKCDGDLAQMIIVADAYGSIKTEVENYRMLTNADIAFRMRGKSIDISVKRSGENSDSYGAISHLMAFAKLLAFNSEDAMDVIEFWNKTMPMEGFDFVEIDMDQTRLKLVMKTEELDQEALMEKLDPFSMGIVLKD